MADKSIVAGVARAVPYELGKLNWQDRRIPDIRNPSSTGARQTATPSTVVQRCAPSTPVTWRSTT